MTKVRLKSCGERYSSISVRYKIKRKKKLILIATLIIIAQLSLAVCWALG